MDFSVALGDRITIVGANGVGKSTLFKMIYNELLPASGTIQRNHKLRVGYYHQHTCDVLPDNITPISYLMSYSDDDLTTEQARAYLGKIGVPSKAHCHEIKTLSGGQKARVALIGTIIKNPHVLLLDEPTNHLDSETINVLESALNSFKGSIIMITHNLSFIENLNTCIYQLINGKLEKTSYDEYYELIATGM